MKFLKTNYILVFLIFISIHRSVSQCSISFNTIPTLGEGCDVLGVQFNSTITGTTIGTPSWNFGDGSAVFSGKNPFHNYTTGIKDTTFDVSLAVTCVNGSKATKTGRVTVFAKPVAKFDVVSSEICTFSDTLKLKNQSETNLQYKWDFGDNTIETDKEPNHIFTVANSYKVSLEVTNTKNCKHRVEKTVVAKPAPNPQFILDNFIGCQPLKVVAINSTEEDAQFKNTGFEWISSNGERLLNDDTANFTFANFGVEEISLKVTNSLGCSVTTAANVLIKQRPTVKEIIKPAGTTCYNTEVSISVETNPVNSSLIWKPTLGVVFKDSTSKTTNFVFENGGLQTFNANIDFEGCKVDTSFSITIFPKPELEITYSPDTICEKSSVFLNVSPSNLASYLFKNNNQVVNSNSANAIIKSASLQNNITLDATDLNGCSQTKNLSIIANPKPNINAQTNALKDTVCFGENIEVTISPNNLSSYNFFANGSKVQSSTKNKYVDSTNATPLEIIVIANNNGCYDTTTTGVIYSKLPMAAPNINCTESSFSSITYSFDQIVGATSYEISINNGPFKTINASNDYIETGLNPNSIATAVLKVTVPSQSPCNTIIVSDTLKCKTIPCEKMDFIAKPTVTRLCEQGSATISVDSIVTPSGFYNLYWNNVKSNSLTFTLDNLTYSNKAYEINISIEDTTRSPECRTINKKALVYVDKQPDTTSFFYTYEVDGFCEPTNKLKVNVINANSSYNYSLIKNSVTSGSSIFYSSPSVKFEYESPDSVVFLQIESPNYGCIAYTHKAITPHDKLESIITVELKDILITSHDSTVCDTVVDSWNNKFSTKIDSITLSNIKNSFSAAKSFNLSRKITLNEKLTVEDIELNTLINLDSIYNFEIKLSSGDIVVVQDSISFYNENKCLVGFSMGNEMEIERPEDCNPNLYLYCSNRDKTVTIKNLEDWSCLNSYSSTKNYFTYVSEGYEMVDSFTVIRNTDIKNANVTIKNAGYKCFNKTMVFCSFYCDSALYIPNTITPNGDGKNDKWQIMHANGIVNLKIYNRWEQMVYSSDNYKNEFDGFSNEGILLPDGVYYYDLSIEGESHLKNEKAGQEAKTFDEIKNTNYNIGMYTCDEKKYEKMKGKLLIQR